VQVERLYVSDGPDEIDRVIERLRRMVPAASSVEDAVRAIVADVELGDDEAVLRYTREHDTAGAEPRPLLVADEELDEAIRELDMDMVAGLQVAIANVADVAQASVGEDVSVALPQGHRVTVREIPVGSAAVYTPGGRAPYPSTIVMGVVTARAAGVLDVAVCSPPRADGQIDPVILGTCRLLGVQRVYRMGGAQAIAALAFGTLSVRQVDMIVGPGNLYVQEAKRQLSGIVGIDGFAGPSDLMAAIGEHANPRIVALDLLAQAEHGEGSLVVAVSHSPAALEALEGELTRLSAESAQAQGAEPAQSQGAACALVRVTTPEAAIELANAFAPEHLELVGTEIEALAYRVRAAGCVFVGAEAATAFGDYVAGSNHILPTAGAARFCSGLSVDYFRRRQSEVRIPPQAAAKLARAGAPIARAEGFEWHARSMEARVRENQEP
jgi:histidinol dehydrogenase